MPATRMAGMPYSIGDQLPLYYDLQMRKELNQLKEAQKK
jgi:hypothetical protein